MSVEIGAVGVGRRILEHEMSRTDERVHVYASRNQVELLADSTDMSPFQARVLAKFLELAADEAERMIDGTTKRLEKEAREDERERIIADISWARVEGLLSERSADAVIQRVRARKL